MNCEGYTEIDCPDCNGTGYEFGGFYGQCDRCSGRGTIDIENATESEIREFLRKQKRNRKNDDNYYL